MMLSFGGSGGISRYSRLQVYTTLNKSSVILCAHGLPLSTLSSSTLIICIFGGSGGMFRFINLNLVKD